MGSRLTCMKNNRFLNPHRRPEQHGQPSCQHVHRPESYSNPYQKSPEATGYSGSSRRS